MHLEVVNESYMHSVPRGSETHFKVVVVSTAFDGVGVLQRHRAVNTLLDPELKGGVHALSIVARTPAQVRLFCYETATIFFYFKNTTPFSGLRTPQ